MGSVLKLKSGKWAIRFDAPTETGERKQKQIGGFLRKTDAEKELKKIEAEILNGDFFHTADVTVSEFLNIWMDDYVKPNLAPKTIAFYESLLRVHFQKYFSKMPLFDLKANQIDAFYRYLRAETNLADNSIHHCHKMLRTALNQAVKWDYIKKSPMYKVTAPKRSKPKSGYWPPDIIPKAMELFADTPIEWMVQVALLSGLREGEICALNANNIDFKHKTFRITETAQRISGQGIILKRPKTDDSMAELPMSEELETIFRKRIAEVQEKKAQTFAAGKPYCMNYIGYLAVRDDGKLMDPNNVGRIFRKILSKQSQIPQITFHDLRHSCASWLIYQNVDMKTIQLILRHSNFKVTADTYSHISQEMTRGALNKLKLVQE